MMRRASAKALALFTAAALVAGACGDDSKETTTPGNVAGGGAAGDLTLNEPLKIVFQWEVRGESEYAIDDFENGARIAVDEINAAGGVGGHKIETVRIASSPVDPQAAVTAFLKGVDEDPDIIIGLGSPIIAAIGSTIDRSGIPTLAVVEDASPIFGTETGSEWLFNMKTPPRPAAEYATKYAIEELKASSVAVLGTNESYGNQGAENIKATLKDAGLSPKVERQFAPDASDLTEQVLALGGSDVVVSWAYPNPVAVLLNQMQQNGVTIPVVGGTPATIAVNGGLVEGKAIDNLYTVDYCNPHDSSRPQLAKFTEEYRKRYNATPNPEAVLTYDAVYVAVEAVKAAGSTDPGAIRDALRTLKYTDGACDSEYRADGAQILHHQLVIADYSADGTAKTVKTYTVPDIDKGGK